MGNIQQPTSNIQHRTLNIEPELRSNEGGEGVLLIPNCQLPIALGKGGSVGWEPMMPARVRLSCVAGVLVCAAGLGAAGAAAPAELAPSATVTVRPEDSGEALVNPDMGWTMHFYSNIPENYGSKLELSDTLHDFPGLSTVGSRALPAPAGDGNQHRYRLGQVVLRRKPG